MDKTRRDSYTFTTIIAVTIIFMREGYFPSLSQFWYLQQHIITKLITTRTHLVGYMIVVCHSKIRKLVVGHFSMTTQAHMDIFMGEDNLQHNLLTDYSHIQQPI